MLSFQMLTLKCATEAYFTSFAYRGLKLFACSTTEEFAAI
jgi:hypothetical protein